MESVACGLALGLLAALGVGIAGLVLSLQPEPAPAITNTTNTVYNYAYNSTVVIFRPSGTAHANVYTTEASLSAAVAGTWGTTIVFDLSQVEGGYTFTTVGALDLGEDAVWTDGENSDVTSLTFGANTTLVNPPGVIKGALEVITQQVQTVMTLTKDAVMTLEGTVLITTLGSGHLISVPANVELFLFMNDASAIEGAEGMTVIQTLSDSFTVLYITANTRVYSNSFTPSSSLVNVVVGSPMAHVDPTLYESFWLYWGGIYVDDSGTALANMNPSQILYDGLIVSNSVVWQSLSGSWVAMSPQRVRTTLASGVSPSVSVAYLSSSTRIVCSHAALNTTSGAGILFAPEGLRSSGRPGSFVVKSYEPNGQVVNTNDGSDIDCLLL